MVSIDDGVLEIKATGGDTHPSGQDFDNALVDHLAKEFEHKNKSYLTKSNRIMRRLRAACETAKITICTSTC